MTCVSAQKPRVTLTFQLETEASPTEWISRRRLLSLQRTGVFELVA